MLNINKAITYRLVPVIEEVGGPLNRCLVCTEHILAGVADTVLVGVVMSRGILDYGASAGSSVPVVDIVAFPFGLIIGVLAGGTGNIVTGVALSVEVCIGVSRLSTLGIGVFSTGGCVPVSVSVRGPAVGEATHVGCLILGLLAAGNHHKCHCKYDAKKQ